MPPHNCYFHPLSRFKLQGIGGRSIKYAVVLIRVKTNCKTVHVSFHVHLFYISLTYLLITHEIMYTDSTWATRTCKADSTWAARTCKADSTWAARTCKADSTWAARTCKADSTWAARTCKADSTWAARLCDIDGTWAARSYQTGVELAPKRLKTCEMRGIWKTWKWDKYMKVHPSFTDMNLPFILEF